MAIPSFRAEHTEGGILTIREGWLDPLTKPDKVEREKQREAQEYIRQLAELNARRAAEIAALQHHARKLGEHALLLQKQAEERAREHAKAKEATQEIEREFCSLAETWYIETMPLSSYVEKVLHPAYLRIIGLGRSVVPLIMNELRDMPHDWFLALRAITGKDPVNPEDAGNLPKMAESWLHWWEQEGCRWLAQGK